MRLNELEKMTLSDETARAAILEAYEELPEEKKEWMRPVADAWENDEEKEEEEDIAAKLGSVFKVTKLK